MKRIVNVLLVDRRGHLLLQERDEHAPRCPEQWGAPGGHVEDGEAFEAAAHRELEEETGCALPPGSLRPWLEAEFRYTGEPEPYHYRLFAAAVDWTDADITCTEGRQMVFVDPEVVPTLDLWESARHFLPRFLASPLYAELAGREPAAERFASVALVDPSGRILMQERDEHPVLDPERWGFPGGHVEPGEDFHEAALRELEEETGVRLDAVEEVGRFLVHHVRTRGHRDSVDEVRLYAAGVDLTDADITCHEGRRMVFVDPVAARGLDLTAGAAASLPALLDSPVYARLAGAGLPGAG